MPPAAILAGRELANVRRRLNARLYWFAMIAVCLLEFGFIYAYYHDVRPLKNDEVIQTMELRSLAKRLLNSFDGQVPIVDVNAPAGLQFYMNTYWPRTKLERAAGLLGDQDPVFVAVGGHAFEYLAKGVAPMHVLARWPSTGAPIVAIVSNHGQLEMPPRMATMVGPIRLNTEHVRLRRARRGTLLLSMDAPQGTITFTNEGHGHELVRFQIENAVNNNDQFKTLAPGERWTVEATRRLGLLPGE